MKKRLSIKVVLFHEWNTSMTKLVFFCPSLGVTLTFLNRTLSFLLLIQILRLINGGNLPIFEDALAAIVNWNPFEQSALYNTDFGETVNFLLRTAQPRDLSGT